MACVTVIRKRRAVTFAHNAHSELVVGKSLKIYPVATESEKSEVTTATPGIDVKVVNFNVESDWVLLESDVDLCEKEPAWCPVKDGFSYIQLGLSAVHQGVSPLAISTGVVSSERPNVYGHTLGSAGANPGDSGGGCFDAWTGFLIGFNVGCENVAVSLDKDTISHFIEKISTRYAARAHIIPIQTFQYL